MAHESEAACLLRAGASYRRRLGLRMAPGALAFAGFKRGGFSLYFDDEPIYHVDLEGRWQRAFVSGVHYLKALDGSTVAIDRVRRGGGLVLKRRSLGFAEAGDLDASIRQAALDLIDALVLSQREAVPPPDGVAPIPPEDLREFLERMTLWDAAAWFALREKYLDTYGPLPLLPPDASGAVVLQATLGHADGLAFGGAEPAEPYVRSSAEFARHARDVAAILGRRLSQSRGLFLAGPDLLKLPLDDVAKYLEEAARVFPIDPEPSRRRSRDLPDESPSLDGISAFLDRFAPPVPDPDGWRRLRALHLDRVTLGVESGSPEVRAHYGKSWTDDDLRATVAGLKGANLAVNVLLLVGSGGAGSADAHLEATAELVNDLPLGRGDLVYLVDAEDVGGTRARDLLRRSGLSPLGAPARIDQQTRLKERLRNLRGAKVVTYSLDKQMG